MSLTQDQLTTLQANILTSPDMTTIPNTDDGAFQIAALYNLRAVPDYWVWKTALTERDATEPVGPEGTSFSWPQYIARTAGEQNGWNRLFHSGVVNPSLPNTRQAVADIFSGAQAAPTAQRTHLLAAARRQASRAEKLFAVGTGTTVSPAAMGYEGAIRYQDVLAARAL